jgi:hypothetical protein
MPRARMYAPGCLQRTLTDMMLFYLQPLGESTPYMLRAHARAQRKSGGAPRSAPHGAGTRSPRCGCSACRKGNPHAAQNGATTARRRRSPLSARRSPLAARRSPLSAVRSPLSALRSPLSALRSPLSALRSPLSALRSPLSARRAPLSALRSPLSALRSPLSALRSPLSAVRSPLTGKARGRGGVGVRGVVRCGVVVVVWWCGGGVVWCGVLRCGVMWCDVVRSTNLVPLEISPLYGAKARPVQVEGSRDFRNSAKTTSLHYQNPGPQIWSL